MRRFDDFYCLIKKIIIKRLFVISLSLIMFLSTKSVRAQSRDSNWMKWKYTGAADFLTPGFSHQQRGNKLGIGITGRAEYFFRKNVSVSLTAGYDYFPGNKYTFYWLDDLIYPPFNYPPEKISAKGVPFTLMPVMAGINQLPLKMAVSIGKRRISNRWIQRRF